MRGKEVADRLKGIDDPVILIVSSSTVTACKLRIERRALCL